MSATSKLVKVLKHRIVAVVRSSDPKPLLKVAEALLDGGVPVMEITMTVPNALEVLASVQREFEDDIMIGAGTVLDCETARMALLAGAEFIVSPTLNLEVIKMCHRYGKLCMPGAFTPTEILSAWEAGASIVKVFPADTVGPDYLRAIRGPLPQVRMMPTGGVSLANARAFLQAGAACLGVGSELVHSKMVQAGDFNGIRDTARKFSDIAQSYNDEN